VVALIFPSGYSRVFSNCYEISGLKPGGVVSRSG
jgi:hypothetical protein